MASAQVMPVPWRGLGRALPAPGSVPGSVPGRAAGADEETMETDLSVLVDAIAAANVKAGLGQQRRPWLVSRA
jgi:S-DNA-T family DNA segregation ATPase FtsK/SpoIIIE